MRVATFNVENLFERPAIMNLPSWADGKVVLEDYMRLNDLINNERYSDTDKSKMLSIMAHHKGLVSKCVSKYIVLREIRGSFMKQTKTGLVEIVANGRQDWIGWFDLVKETINRSAIDNTARVIKEINADVLCVIEAESRGTLKDFNDQVIPSIGGAKYKHVMLIDGNDARGIDVGIMLKEGYTIQGIVSHVDDTDEEGLLFSRDCPEYVIGTPAGGMILLLVNHFKSKGYGSASASNAKRKRQATRVREIYDARVHQGIKQVIIAGDFNDTPDSDPLSPLLQCDSDLKDIMEHTKFVGDGRPGTHGNGTKSGKFDYILTSPYLFNKVIAGGIERRGVWGGKHGTLFPHFNEIVKEKDAASDHAALWVDLKI